jgi:small subunit ribosomal protein S21
MSGLSRVTVEVRNGDIAKALKKFKKKVNESGHLLELRERKEYVKPTTKRRLQKQKAIREEQKRVALMKIAEGDRTIRFFTKKRKKKGKDEQKPQKDKNFE